MRFKGSVTIFLTLILLAVLALVGGLLESTRLNVAKEVTLDASYLAIQNILAEYQRELWNDYHIFFVDESLCGGDEEITKKANQSLKDMLAPDEKSLLGAEAFFTGLNMNEAMTEGKCKYFTKQAIAYMKEAAPREIVTTVLGDVKGKEALIKGQEAVKKVVEAKLKLEKKLISLQNKKEEIRKKQAEWREGVNELREMGRGGLNVPAIRKKAFLLKREIHTKREEMEGLSREFQKEKLEKNKEIEAFQTELESEKQEMSREDYESLKKSSEESYSPLEFEDSFEKNERQLDEIISLTEKEGETVGLKKALQGLEEEKEQPKMQKAKKNLREYETKLKRDEEDLKEAGTMMRLLGISGMKLSSKKIKKTRWKIFDDGKEIEDITLADRALLFLYIKKHFSHFLGKPLQGKERDKEALDYGIEYIVIGQEEDEKNLRGVFQKILVIRTGAWFVYYLSRADKVMEATQIATALVGALGPAAVATVKTAIIMGWAVKEAREDVKNLSQGKEVSLYPGNEALKAGYEKYLDMFLLLEVGNWAVRSVELIEQNIKVRYYKDFRADNCFSGILGEGRGRVLPRFFHLPFLSGLLPKELTPWEFEFQLSESLSR